MIGTTAVLAGLGIVVWLSLGRPRFHRLGYHGHYSEGTGIVGLIVTLVAIMWLVAHAAEIAFLALLVAGLPLLLVAALIVGRQMLRRWR